MTIQFSPEVRRGVASEDAASVEEAPTTHERRMMALLARGCTDEDAAAKLGWSRRTLQRNLKRAMDKLGARSRVEAGYLLARSRWLEDDREEPTHLRHEARQG